MIDNNEIRKLAEEMARRKATLLPENLDTLSPEQVEQTLHELQVHQIELEIQNEELRRAQAEIDAAQARYFDFYNLAPVGYCTLSEKGLILEVNLTAATILGVSRAALARQPITRYIHKEDLDIYYLHRKQLFNTSTPQVCELRFVKRENDEVLYWTRLESITAKDSNDQTICQIVISDITERKQAEEALLKSEKKYRTLQENLPVGLLRTTPDGKLLFANPALVKIFGYESIEEFMKINVTDFYLNKQDRKLLIALAVEDSVINFEAQMKKKDGTTIWTSISMKASFNDEGELLYLDGFCKDITERKKTENALKRNEELYLALFQNNPIQTVVVDKSCKIIAFNKAKETSGDRLPNIGEVMYKDYAKQHNIDMNKELMECISSGEMREFPEQAYKNKVLSIKISPFEDGAIIISQDITARKRAEEKIEHLNELLLAIRNVDQLIAKEKNTERLTQGICDCLVRSRGHKNIWMTLTDDKNNVIAASDSGFGSKFKNFIKNQKNLSSLNCFNQIKNDPEIIVRHDNSSCGECVLSTEDQNTGRVIIQLKYNNKIYGLMNVGVLNEFIDEEQEKALLEEVAGDIAFGLYNIELEKEKKELQMQLYRSARLSAVGQLAAGVAHEFNNLLSIILGHTQLSLEEDSIDEIKKSLKEIEKSTKRGSGIVIKLATFAKPKNLEFMTQEIGKIIDDVIRLQERQLRMDSIEIETHHNIRSKASLDRGQMEQVFLNLLINSVHAIKPKGRGKIIITANEIGDNIEIRFSDNGIGMDKQIKTKIFDPFFTTKGAWAKDGLGISGTGLGLSIAYSIIKQHNGTITVKSQKNKGTTFIIKLPIDTKGHVAEESPGYNISQHDIEKIKGMRILLVDDENEMTEVFKQLLKKAGFQNYKVENNGEKAVSIFKEFKPDIVFLDIVMPEMGGEKILKKIKAIDENTPVVFISGKVDTDKDIYLKSGAFDYLQKPFEIFEIYNILNKIIKTESNKILTLSR